MKIADNLYIYPEKGMLDCNTYIIKGKPGLIIDAGSTDLIPMLVEDMGRDGIKPEDIEVIANTHLHLDHCGANQAFKNVSGARITLHPLQKQDIKVSFYETANFFGVHPDGFKEDGCFTDESLKEIGLDWEMILAPGHSQDSVCYYSATHKCLVSGDVVFACNIGRFDLPGGDAVQLANSIRKLSDLDVELLLPGHMGIVSGAQRVKDNFRLVLGFFEA
ncbi:MAG: MBL fold metallo-hydrolase [Chloroflexi bacterium]|nr:MBL fold metallo-hydrolase [Chloroflexota bacterium]